MLVGSVQAQNSESAKADTLIINDKTIVVTIDEDGHRVYIDGEEANEADSGYFFFDGEPGHKGFGVFEGPDGKRNHVFMRHKRGVPGTKWFDNQEGKVVFGLDGIEPVMDRLGDLAFFGDGPLQFQWKGSMKERVEISRMDMESRRLAHKVRDANGDERTRLEAELDELLDDIYNRKQQIRAEEIERLEKRLAELRDTQQLRRSSRNDIIERRKKELLGERDELDW